MNLVVEQTKDFKNLCKLRTWIGKGKKWMNIQWIFDRLAMYCENSDHKKKIDDKRQICCSNRSSANVGLFKIYFKNMLSNVNGKEKYQFSNAMSV